MRALNCSVLNRICNLSYRALSRSVIDIKPEVQKCLNEKKPVVAFESTIITHGMPYPFNLEMAKSCEDIIRSENCTPAVIAVIKGRVKVGLNEEQLKYVAESSNEFIKTSRRDFPYVLSNKLNGGTTVSGAVVVSSAVGIKVFATGGIGGVHRKGEETMDISSDLVELGRNPIMVVSSGIKSILDIGRTLEYLETQGVLVCSYNRDSTMPAFYSQNSSFKAPYCITSPEQAASLLASLSDMRLNSGILLAVPIPQQNSFDYDKMEAVINDALKQAQDVGITGKETTPFLLEKISQLTKGESLESNIALIKNNSMVAAKIAYCYSNTNAARRDKIQSADKNVVVIGGSVVDVTVSLKEPSQFDGRTVDANMVHHPGGVARNLADALGKLGCQPTFISAVGRDRNGDTVLNSLKHINKSSIEVLENEMTASYMVLLNDKGDCLLCAGNSDIHSKTNIEQVKRNLNKIDNSNMVVMDSNLSEETLEYVMAYCCERSIPIWIEPTSLLKCHKMLTCSSLNGVKFVSPNLTELRRMSSFLGAEFDENFHDDRDRLLNQVLYLGKVLSENIKSTLMITMGKFGTVMLGDGSSVAHYYPGHAIDDVTCASGAGDCAAAAFISAYLRGLTHHQCVHMAQYASRLSLFSKSPVPDSFDILPEPVKSAHYSVLTLN